MSAVSAHLLLRYRCHLPSVSITREKSGGGSRQIQYVKDRMPISKQQKRSPPLNFRPETFEHIIVEAVGVVVVEPGLHSETIRNYAKGTRKHDGEALACRAIGFLLNLGIVCLLQEVCAGQKRIASEQGSDEWYVVFLAHLS